MFGLVLLQYRPYFQVDIKINVTELYGPLKLAQFYQEYWWASLWQLKCPNVSAHVGAQKGSL